MNMIQFNRDGKPYDVFFHVDFQKKLVDNIVVTCGGLAGDKLTISESDRDTIKRQIEYEIAIELLDDALADRKNLLKN